MRRPTWRGIIAVRGRHVGIGPRRALPAALRLRLCLRGEARIIRAALLRGPTVRRRRREVHGRVSARGGTLLLLDLLEKLLRLPVLVVGARGIELGLVRVRILHGHIAVAVVVLWTAALGSARRGQRGHRVGPRGCRGRGVWVLLCLRWHIGVPGVLRACHVMGSVPRLAARSSWVGVGSPLLVHCGGRLREERGLGVWEVGKTAGSAVTQLMQAVHAELRRRNREMAAPAIRGGAGATGGRA